MKVTTKTDATEQELNLIASAARTAKLYKHLTPGSPLRPQVLGRYERIVEKLGYDPIS
ncbi:hypothetical protein TPA0907_56020 [Micromonospora humidisoli]|uniref:hypothetical protein n=1 Tax=unclassified Micromonospora TaxID=2617518 RepID=UPI0022BD877D|nr:hypothetical protein [Micromonospora sp. AKA109]GHJ11235.1 hypothetical protein TPA0907_56020 [Micromonospora sp. AKA109]